MERLTRTVLFAVVEGSSLAKATLGDDVGERAVQARDRVIRDATDGHDGELISGRYGTLETLRTYGQQRLVGRGELQEATRWARQGVEAAGHRHRTFGPCGNGAAHG